MIQNCSVVLFDGTTETEIGYMLARRIGETATRGKPR